MPINQYFNYQPLPQGDFSFKAPLEMMGKTLAYLQDKSDKNYAALDAVPSMLNVPVLEEDAQNRANVENKYRERIKQIVDKTGGDYSNVQKDVLSIQNDLRKDLSFSGSLGAMKSNYDAYGAYDKRLKENKTLKDFERYAATKTARANFAKNGGTGIVDPVTGKYNYFSGIDVDGFDRAKFLNDIKEIKPISEEEVTTYMQNNYIIDRTKGREGVTRQRAYDIAKADLRSNENYQQYIRQMKSVGIDLSAQDEENALQAFASERSYSKTKDDLKRTFDHNLIFNEDRRHHAVMEKNTAPIVPQAPPLFNLPMQKGMGLDLDKKIGIDNRNISSFGFGEMEGVDNEVSNRLFNNIKKPNNVFNFNHDYVKEDKTGVSRQAMNLSGQMLWEQYKKDQGDKMPANQKNKEWNQFDEAGKNGILSAMSNSPQYKEILKSSIDNNYASIARYYNNSVYKGSGIFSNEQAKENLEAMNRNAGSIMMYNQDGSKTGKTLTSVKEDFIRANNIKGDVKTTPYLIANAPKIAGMTLTEMSGVDKDGKPTSIQYYADNDPRVSDQWRKSFAAWDKDVKSFPMYGMNNGKPEQVDFERTQTGIIYNSDGSSAAEFHIAKPVGNKMQGDNDGMIFTTNIRDMRKGAMVGSADGNGKTGEFKGLQQLPDGNIAAYIKEDGVLKKYIVKEKGNEMEATILNTPQASMSKPQGGYKSSMFGQ